MTWLFGGRFGLTRFCSDRFYFINNSFTWSATLHSTFSNDNLLIFYDIQSVGISYNQSSWNISIKYIESWVYILVKINREIRKCFLVIIDRWSTVDSNVAGNAKIAKIKVREILDRKAYFNISCVCFEFNLQKV